MAASILDIERAKSAKIAIIEDSAKGRQAVHDVVVAMQANRRTANAHTKTRGEVAATGKKPYRQKGTGRARRGGNASPITRGGGVAFGPRNAKDYSKKVNKATKRLAFAKALSERIAEGAVHTVPEFAIADGKTKSYIAAIAEIGGKEDRALVVAKAFSEETKRAARNHRPSLLMSADEVNTEQLLRYRFIVVAEDALETLASRTEA